MKKYLIAFSFLLANNEIVSLISLIAIAMMFIYAIFKEAAEKGVKF